MPPPITTYEVYHWKNGQWQLSANYPGDKANIAMQDAQTAERTNNQAVKVVRETYNPDSSTTNETVVYLSEKIRTGKKTDRTPENNDFSVMSGYDGMDDLGGSLVGGEDYFSSGNEKVFSSVGASSKLAIIIVASLILAGAASALAILVANLITDHSLTTSQSTSILFGVFIMVFIMSAAPLSVKTINWAEFTLGGRDDDVIFSDGKMYDTTSNYRKKRGMVSKFIDFITGTGTAKADRLFEEQTPVPKKPIAELKKEEERIIIEEAIEEEEKEETPPEEETIEEEITEEPEQEEIAEEEEDSTVIPPELEKQQKLLVDFLSGIMSAIRSKYPQMNTYNRFGINLFLAGGIDPLKQKYSLSDDEGTLLLTETIKATGTDKAIANSFCEKLEEYLLEPKYLSMLKDGNEAMELMLSGDTNAFLNTCESFDKWHNNEEAKAEVQQPSIVTVMFTDMVGSTDTTQTMGDSGAQQLVRIHNKVVREALKEFSGREVKHTGDGIMASFNSPSSSVNASISIMAGIAKHNEENPHLPLYLRIGLNAGEPITEENDLFGTTVQLAARICDKANKEQILVSNVVKELAAGSTHEFISIGAVPLKGVKEPQILFEVVDSSKAKESSS